MPIIEPPDKVDRPEPGSPNPNAKRKQYSLERGWVTRKLIHELARMEKTVTKLAEEYGVYPSAISQFKARHATEIDEIKKDIEDAFAGLWITNKSLRIAEYQAEIDIIEDSRGGGIRSMSDVEMSKLKSAILKAVAEELGQIPNKVSLDVRQKVTYEIEGIDPESLR